MNFVVGQRWVSEAEPELGLGRVERIERRRVWLHFPATGTKRQYAQESAPIKRVVFREGDEIEDSEGVRLRVERVVETDGLLVYGGNGTAIREGDLSGAIRFSKPEERLLGGHWDESRAFDLRYRALAHQHEVARSPARGFLGARIELVPHQLFIAREVSSRSFPRALLADEVGLGKTIEAGLIVHRLIRSHRIRRVLVLVPETLVHQWFVEMLRRFHLSFTIVDEEHCEEVEASRPGANPFLETQTAIAGLDFVVSDRARARRLIEAHWDMVVVDEAHHLSWTPDEASPQYRLVEALAWRAPGLLLLTATPEQLGEQPHFARLRLLDPDRYPDYDRYAEEAETFRAVAPVAEKLAGTSVISKRDRDTLRKSLPGRSRSLEKLLDAASSAKDGSSARARLLDELLDRHGPGRVVFRNARRVLEGFPDRRLRPVALSWPAEPAGLFRRLAREFAADELDTETVGVDYDFTDDPRARWLVARLGELAPEKVLVICRYRSKAVALHEALRRVTTTPLGVFHEGLSLLQRDRNAAWFSDIEAGAQALLCSEIGSEGRNFQFAHHLVLFDLPPTPELLEQRIGRLHRIGQSETVQIHVPYLPGTAQEMLFLWYHEGLDAFEQSLPSGEHFDEIADELRDRALDHVSAFRGELGERIERPRTLAPLLERTVALRRKVAAHLEAGRDRLLELGSLRPETARSLIHEIRRWDASRDLDEFLSEALDYLGSELDEVAPRTYVLRQSNDLIVEALPGLRAGEVGMTSDRDRATHQGELDFLTWDHPMVTGVLELLAGGERGNSAVALLPSNADATWLEAIFVLHAVAPPELDVERFLPPTPIRLLVDERGNDVGSRFPPEALAKKLVDGRKALRYGAYGELAERVRGLLARARCLAESRQREVVARASDEMSRTLTGEIDRLRYLAEVNDHVRPEEIRRREEERDSLARAISSAGFRLDALRLVRLSRTRGS